MNEKTIVLIVVILALLYIFMGGSGVKTKPASQLTEQDILDALKEGKKVTAIKYYRSVHGVGLSEAKEAVEKMYKNLSTEE